MIQFLCPICGRALKIHERHSGNNARCPGCNQLFLVPAVDSSGRKAQQSPATPALGKASVPSALKPAQLLLLSKFRQPRLTLEFEQGDYWRSALGEPPIQAIQRLAKQGLLVQGEQASESGTLSCPHCQQTILDNRIFAGQVVSCPGCGGDLRIPAQNRTCQPKPVDKVIYPVIDKAKDTIRALLAVPHSELMRLSVEARRDVFSVPGIENIETILKVKRIVAYCFEKGEDFEDFARKFQMAFENTLALSDNDLEKVYRGTVNRALISGMLKTLEHPIITGGFPYLSFNPIHDDRTPETHLALEHFGLNGTNIFRRDDPFWRKFMPPLTDLCRCSVIALTIRSAAEKGVKEAQDWLKTGQPPKRPEWVKSPQFDPRLEVEDEGQVGGKDPQEILKDVLALRDHLIKEMEKSSSGPRKGRLPRNVLRAPTTVEEGLALLQGRSQPVYMLPPLEGYFSDMERCVADVPLWKGEPENDLEYLATIDAIIACCRQAFGQG
jgi:DNA-directed RNA polymerase subunit RPC12/RpoP